MIKLLSIIIPCYNSVEYMNRAIESSICAGADVEVIIIDDGSVDKTYDVAKSYEKKYPDIIKVIKQGNKGHGGAVNTGIKNAIGLYTKVLDSDDYFDKKSLLTLVNKIRQFYINKNLPDIIISNFVYDKIGKINKKVMKYTNMFDENKILTWDRIGRIHLGQYIIMHSSTFKTEILKKSNLQLPEKTFYVDNIFMFIPMHYVKTLYYLNINLYRYFIGRSDQSVNEKVMCSRIDQQIRVTKILIDSLDMNLLKNKKHREIVIGYLNTILLVSSVLLNKIGTQESINKKKEMWQYLKSKNYKVYKMLKKTPYGIVSNIPTKLGRNFINIGYRISQKIYGFN